jgi:hypothetical protein
VIGTLRTQRRQRPEWELLQLREKNSEAITELRHDFVHFLHQVRERQLAHDKTAGNNGLYRPFTFDVLIVSGGGDKGAFGAGFLKGWKSIPATHEMSLPEFDVVTGVSTGALIAPFAFLGGEWIDRIDDLYRHPKKDWVKRRKPFYFLPMHISFASVPGLERDLRRTVTMDMVRHICTAGQSGRLLIVNTTNLDDDSPRVFFLVPESERALRTGDLDRLHNVVLASTGIPGVLPYREIDGEMYVDGGVTGNIIYGGRLGEGESFVALWEELFGSETMPKFRFWVLFNNQRRKPPIVVPPRWPVIFTRSMELATRAASLMAIRHLFAMAEISRLKRNADVEVRYVAIPEQWKPKVSGSFQRQTMNELAKIGERMGADPNSWSTKPPPA